MDILYCAQWKRAKRRRCREDPPTVRPLVAVLRIALAVGLIFGGATVLDRAAVQPPQQQAAN
jgi:hypothetical protein